MHRTATDVVAVFCQVGQMTEIGKAPNDAHCVIAWQAFEEFLQSFVCRVIGITPERHGQFANFFNQLVNLGAFLLTDHITQNSAQKSNVFDQWAFVVARMAFQRGNTGVGHDKF